MKLAACRSIATQSLRRNICTRCCNKTLSCFTRCFSFLRSVSQIQTCRRVALIYVVTFLIILPLSCNDLNHSAFYRNKEPKPAAVERLKAENSKRLESADKLLANYSSIRQVLNRFLPRSNLIHQDKLSHLAITYVTVSRNREDVIDFKPRYLTQAITAVLNQLSVPLSINFHLSIAICNVDWDPKRYKEAYNLSAILNVTHFVHYSNKEVDPFVNVFEKEKQDYAFCINETINTFNASYNLILEDDALLQRNAFQVLDNVLNFRLKNKFEDALFMKLFHPDRVTGYISFEVERIPELLSVGSVFGTLFTFIYISLQRNSARFFFQLWIAMMFYASLVALCIGRTNLSELRRLSPHLYALTPAPSCCTPAMLFPTKGGKAYVDMLSQVQCKKGNGKDMAPLDLIKKSGLKTYMLHPNLVNHIGLYSSLRQAKKLNPDSVD